MLTLLHAHGARRNTWESVLLDDWFFYANVSITGAAFTNTGRAFNHEWQTNQQSRVEEIKYPDSKTGWQVCHCAGRNNEDGRF